MATVIKPKEVGGLLDFFEAGTSQRFQPIHLQRLANAGYDDVETLQLATLNDLVDAGLPRAKARLVLEAIAPGERRQAARRIFAVILVCPTSMDRDAPKEETQLSFDGRPAFDALVDRIDQASKLLKGVNFSIRKGKEDIHADNWELVTETLTAIKLTIFPQIAKPASSFTDEEGLELLLGPEYKQANKQPFPMAEINKSALLNDGVNQATGLQTDEDLLNHLGIDLALRCLCIEPCALAKEYPKREFISPVLYAASILSGELEIFAEYSAKDHKASGRVDYAVLLNGFAISILEGKVHDALDEHEGQLYASMHACRKQYLRQQLSKRKRDADPMSEVPSAGILTSGTSYIFYKCHHGSQPRITRSEYMPVGLRKGIEAKTASEAVLTVLRTMVQLFLDQKRALASHWAKQAAS